MKMINNWNTSHIIQLNNTGHKLQYLTEISWKKIFLAAAEIQTHDLPTHGALPPLWPFLWSLAIFHQYPGPELVASALGDLVVVANKQLLPSQGLIIQASRRATASLKTQQYRGQPRKVN